MKRWDEEHGENIEKYKDIVKTSMAATHNFELLKTTYYIHSSRKKNQLKLKKWVMNYSQRPKLADRTTIPWKTMSEGLEFTGKHH